MELKDTYYRDAKTRRQTKTTGEKKGGWICWFSSEYYLSLLGRVAAVTNALIRFLEEFRGTFMCVSVCAGGQRRRGRV